MAEKKYFWLKMPRNFFEKHYIKILRAKDNGDLLVMFYIWMITESIDHEGKLRFSEDIPYDAEMLAEASGFALQIVTQALQQFSKLQLVVTESDGTLFLPKSLKMIGSESASAQRVREYREREKNKTKPTETPENAECNERVTESNVNVQKGNIEKELSTLWVDMLKESMIRSLYRDSDKLIQTEDEQYISRLRSQIDKARTERDRESKKYLRLWKTVRKEFGDEKAWELIEKAEE